MIKEILKKTIIVQCSDTGKKGSGFVVDQKGLIATNYHVIEESQNMKILFDGGEKLDATIVISNKEKDFAILKIDKKLNDYFKMGSFSRVKEFSEILFSGQGLDVPKISVHKGWVSRKIEGKLNYLQIDGPINQGNSGGPVINSKGEVVAIVTQTEAKFDGELLEILDFLPSSRGKVIMFGIDLGELFRRMIAYLNRNRFVGIGYAFSVEYIKKALRESEK